MAVNAAATIWSLPSSTINPTTAKPYTTKLIRQGGIRQRRAVETGHIDSLQIRSGSQQPCDKWRRLRMTASHSSMNHDTLPENEARDEKERQLSIVSSAISHDDKAHRTISAGPQNWDAVTIRDAGDCGRGVFANVDFDKGHKIIVEKPIVSCIHWMLRHGRRTIAEDWEKLSRQKQLQMTTYFTRLSSIPVGQALLPRHKKVLEQFIQEYAFWDPQRARAHIYLLVSHINHACISCANAEHRTDSEWPHRIHIKLVKPVKAEEEILIHYGRKTPFGCAVCGPRSFRDRVKSLACGIFK